MGATKVPTMEPPSIDSRERIRFHRGLGFLENLPDFPVPSEQWHGSPVPCLMGEFPIP